MNSIFELIVPLASEHHADRRHSLRVFDLEFAYQRVLSETSTENFAAFVTAYRRTGNGSERMRDYLLACADDVEAVHRAHAAPSEDTIRPRAAASTRSERPHASPDGDERTPPRGVGRSDR